MKYQKPLYSFLFPMIFAVLGLCASLASAQQTNYARVDGSHWVGTWAASAQQVEAKLLPAELPSISDVTVRQIVRVSIGGKQVRVRFSNAFSGWGNALDITGATIAVSAGGHAVEANTLKPLSFHGRSSVTIPWGALMISDPIDFDLEPGADLVVSIHIGKAVKEVTGHRAARCDVFLQAGNAISAPELKAPLTNKVWYSLAGVDVLAPQSAGAVVCFGDSITDGKGATEGANLRWPDILARRLQANADTAQVGVLNQGIGGNGLFGGLGQPALMRLDRDVLTQPGGRWLVLLVGINDLGGGKATADDIITAYEQIVMRAHDSGLRVYGATILPCGGSDYFNKQPELEAKRNRINSWIRTSGMFDAVIDFDAVMRDPIDPTRLLKSADCGDHLHPSDEGYRMMAEAVDLNLFKNGN